MKQQLSDLIDTPLTSLGADKSKMTESFTSNKENEEEFQIKLSKIESAKRRDRQKSHKLSEDLNCLRKEHEVLKERCQQLEGEVKKQVRNNKLPSLILINNRVLQLPWQLI